MNENQSRKFSATPSGDKIASSKPQSHRMGEVIPALKDAPTLSDNVARAFLEELELYRSEEAEKRSRVEKL